MTLRGANNKSRNHDTIHHHRLLRVDLIPMYITWVMVMYESPVARLIRRPIWRAFYRTISHQFMPEEVMTYLNLGFLSSASEFDNEGNIADRVSELLYDEVMAGLDLSGFVAEIGCGPGHGSAYMAAANHSALFIGVDFSRGMISWCDENHRLSNLRFMEGDALDLPFASGSLDAVVNIESSHCYRSRAQFFQQVARVLKPGGAFLYADFVQCIGKNQGPDALNGLLREAGLCVEECVDITDNVLAARDTVTQSADFRSRIPRRVGILHRPVIEEILCLTGTNFYKLLASRWECYTRWKATKPIDADCRL
jgi:SAM-dependent methyltransferase